MAGAIATGQVADSQAACNKLSQIPLAILARVLHEAGATSIRSAQRPSITWFAHPSSSKRPESTLFLDNVEKVNGDTKSNADLVIIIFTSAPFFMSNLNNTTALYAAMLPVTHNSIFFP